MKLFCSTAITGEDKIEVTRRMRLVTETLHAAGHDAYCQLFDPYVDELKSQGVKDILRYAFEKLVQCDGIVVIVTSDRKSEGMLMEVGAALATNKPMYLFWRTPADSESHLPKIATEVFHWQTDGELQDALKQL